MTQNLGSTSNPLSMTGEQWVLEERTDDPLSPDPGECWIRTDLNAGDKIATLKFGDGSEVPIFPTGTSETGVLEVRRVQTGGQTGYLPVADLDFATFPQLRLQHNNTVYGLHNDIEAVASLSIDTLEAEDIESDSVTIRGEITEIDAGGDDATVRFDWGESNAGLPNTTADQLQGTTGIFSEGLTGLTDDTQYEFRAEGEVRDVFDEGAILSFTTPSAIPDSGISRYTFDEGSGTTAVDEWGNNDGAINGATYTTDAFQGSHALSFTAADGDYVSIGDTTELAFGDGSNDSAFSVAARIKMTDATRFRIVSRAGESTSDTRNYFFGTNADDKFLLVLYDSSGSLDDQCRQLSDSAVTSDEGSYISVCATYDGSSSASGITLYRNGSSFASTGHTGVDYTAMDAVGDTDIGRFRGGVGDFADGIIDDPRFWNKELTPTEVSNWTSTGSI